MPRLFETLAFMDFMFVSYSKNKGRASMGEVAHAWAGFRSGSRVDDFDCGAKAPPAFNLALHHQPW